MLLAGILGYKTEAKLIIVINRIHIMNIKIRSGALSSLMLDLGFSKII